jgi:hypothetical protein
MGKHGRSRQLGYWIRGGLKYAMKAGRRYFFEQDVIEYIWQRYLKVPETSVREDDSD